MLALVLLGCSEDADTAERLHGNWIPAEAPSVELSKQFDPSAAQITFHSDGTWSASDGCNELSGTYSIEGTSFSAEGDSGAGVGCGGGQIPYDLLLTQTDHLAFNDDGTVTFESSRDVKLLVLATAEDAE